MLLEIASMNDDTTLDILRRLDRLEDRVSTLEAGSTLLKETPPAYAPPPIKTISDTPPPIIARELWDVSQTSKPTTPSSAEVWIRDMPQPSPPVSPATAEETELTLGTKVLPWTGAGLVVLGISYLTGLAIQRNWLTPMMQFAGAILLCLLFVGLGIWKDRKNESIGQLLLGIGSAGLYMTFASGNLTFELYGGEVMVGLFVLHSATNLVFGTLRGSKSFVVMGMIGGLISALMPILKHGVHSHESWVLTLTLHFAVSVATCFISVRKKWDDVLTGYLWTAFAAFIPIVLNIPTNGVNQGILFAAYGLTAAGVGNSRVSKAITTGGLLMMVGAVWFADGSTRESLPGIISLHAFATATAIWISLRQGWKDVLGGVACALLLPFGSILYNPHLTTLQASMIPAVYGAAIIAIGLWRKVDGLTLTGFAVLSISGVLPLKSGNMAAVEWPVMIGFHALSVVATTSICYWKRWSLAAVGFGAAMTAFLLPFLFRAPYDPMVRGAVAYAYGLVFALGFAWRFRDQDVEGNEPTTGLAAFTLGILGFMASMSVNLSQFEIQKLRASELAGIGLGLFAAVVAIGAHFLANEKSKKSLVVAAAVLGLLIAPQAWSGSHLLSIYSALAGLLAVAALVLKSRVLATLAWSEFLVAIVVYIGLKVKDLTLARTEGAFEFGEPLHLWLLIGLTVLVAFTSGLLDNQQSDGEPDHTNSNVLAVFASCAGWFFAGNLALISLSSLPQNARLTIAWAAVGLALLPIGFIAARRVVRFTSFSLLGLTLAKIIMIDLSQVDLPIRIVVLIALGSAILGLSYLFYLKPKHPVR